MVIIAIGLARLKLNIEEIITDKLVQDLINSSILFKFALLKIILSSYLQ